MTSLQLPPEGLHEELVTINHLRGNIVEGAQLPLHLLVREVFERPLNGALGLVYGVLPGPLLRLNHLSQQGSLRITPRGGQGLSLGVHFVLPCLELGPGPGLLLRDAHLLFTLHTGWFPNPHPCPRCPGLKGNTRPQRCVVSMSEQGNRGML